jgi:hypothetical protein
LPSLSALLVVLAACGSDPGAAPSGGAQDTKPTDSASAGAPATPPTAAPPKDNGAPPTMSSMPTTPPANTPPSAAAGAPGSAAPNMPATPPPADMNKPTDDPSAMDPATTPPADDVMLPHDTGTPTLIWLEIASGTVTKAGADGSNPMVIASSSSAPDGVTIDPEGKHFFVLNMGTVIGGGNGGSLVRYNLDGSGSEIIMPRGSMADGETFNTGKQVTIDRVNKKLYMGDREGSKVWRVDYDGKNLEVLISGHDIDQIVGVGADPTKRHFYFSDRNGKKLYRASMDMPAGKTHADRDDLELIYVEKVSNAMPLDIELDLELRQIYWTDRRRNMILGMNMDMPMGETADNRTDVKTVLDGLTEAIGLAFDHQEKTLFVTHSGTVTSVKTDGTGRKVIGSSGSTGISFARLN